MVKELELLKNDWWIKGLSKDKCLESVMKLIGLGFKVATTNRNWDISNILNSDDDNFYISSSENSQELYIYPTRTWESDYVKPVYEYDYN